MAYNAVEMSDWQISEAAEKNMPTPEEWREKLGLEKDEMLPMGRLSKLDFLKIIERLKDKPDGKYIEVTAITPTPLGEGKSTTSMGLMEGMGKRGLNVGGCLRQPSGGPTMNDPGGSFGPPSRFCAKLVTTFRVNVAKPPRGRTESSLPEFSTGSTGSS